MENLGVDGMIKFKLISRRWNGEALIGLSWLRIGTDGGLL